MPSQPQSPRDFLSRPPPRRPRGTQPRALGGLISLGAIAAPSIFKTLRDPAALTATTNPPLTHPNQLGGEIFGNILSRFSLFEIACLLTMLLAVTSESLLLRRAMLSKPWHLLRVLLLLAATSVLAYDTLILFPQAIATRTAWRAALDTPTASQLQAQFDTLHQRSESLGHTKAYLLLALLALTTLANTSIPPMPPAKPTPITPNPL